jgi:rhodanese-related sulfurtransferase
MCAGLAEPKTGATVCQAAARGLAGAYLGSRKGLEPISGDELLARLKAGEPLVVVDVRAAEEYQAAHVAGAVSIPLGELDQRLRESPSEREVVAYCCGPYCAFAPEAVRTLREHGYPARYLTDGLPEWTAARQRCQVGDSRSFESE